MASDAASEFRVPPATILIAGPTAVGKSELAFRLAQELRGEIISVDSMQVYRGMDIGTAKLTWKQRQEIPHHLIDVVDVKDPFSVAQFVRLAEKALAEIKQRGGLPIFCGGTGLYFKALLQGLGTAPPPDLTLRAQLESVPLDQLLQELAQADPVMFEKIDKNNSRRVIRAVEVIRTTGRAYSVQRAEWGRSKLLEVHPPKLIGLVRPLAELQGRIDARVEAMFASGLVDETKMLLKQGLAENPIAMQALGYRQVIEYLNGKQSMAETVALVKVRTRQFVKRQMTWFRRQAEVDWIEIGSDSDEALAKLRHAVALRVRLA